MSDNIKINQLDPTTFEYQEYSLDDTSLITNIQSQSLFNPKSDKIEYFVYDLNGNIIYETYNYSGYKLIDNILNINPYEDLIQVGYNEGQYNTLYNFVNPLLSSNPNQVYFISEISTDRTEIRLDTNSIPNDLVISSSLELINNIQSSTGSYFDFYLDLGSNELAIANNILLDTSSISNPTILIKLYEPLPGEFNLNTQCWVVNKISDSIAYSISIEQVFEDFNENIPLRGPNTNLLIQDQIANSTEYSNLSQLSTTTTQQGTGSLRYQLNNLLAKRGVAINVDYTNYDNFIHFSSAQTRLENFYYKLSLIETYQDNSNLSTNSSSGSFYVSSSNVVWQSKIDDIITGFDNYEYHLYYNSGSTSWPKTNSSPPFINYTTVSTSGSEWFVSQSQIAEEYDIQNNNRLINTIPSYLTDDPNDQPYKLFVEMVGQFFDNVFLYTQDITNKYNADNRVNYGVSKDIVADILRDLGIKIYQNNFSTNDLYSALLGLTPSGSLLNLPYITNTLPTPTGYEYINVYTTASSTDNLIPTEDVNASIYKRIYANLPYLLKKKGTVEGLKSLITLYGIPNTILQVNEFGGQNKVDENDYDLWFNQFDYAFDTNGGNYITSSFIVNSNWDTPQSVPSSVEFRFKTKGLPTNSLYYSQSLWSTDTGTRLQLRYTGSGNTSGSYSGSIPNPYNEFALLEFIPDSTTPSTSASLYLPVFDGEWWSVLINRDTNNFTLYAGNKNYLGTDINSISYLESSSIVGNGDRWGYGLTSYLGSGSFGQIFSGSFQEYRFYNESLNVGSFKDYVMYPYSINSNGINTAPDTLIFRASLGGELYTGSTSIHPKVTGSWSTTQSFDDGTSGFVFIENPPIFTTNKEVVYPNQFPSGIKNRVSNKIIQENGILPYSGSNETNLPQNTILSPFISVQQNNYESGSYTPDIIFTEIVFSPQNEINNDIAGQLGYFNIGEYIGDPRLVSSSSDFYPELNSLRDYYFEKYTSNYNIWDYIRLIKYFDNSLFKMIQDWVPAKTSLSSGIQIKQTVLERNKYPVPQLEIEESIITGSGIQMYTITGSTGGSTPDLIPDDTLRAVTASNGQMYTAEYGTPVNPMLNLTQSWLGSTSSPLGPVPFTQSISAEFFNGELSGSNLVVEDGELNPLNPVKKPTTQVITYIISGSTSTTPTSGEVNWNVASYSPGGIPIMGTQYISELYVNTLSNNGINISTALSNLNPGSYIIFPVEYELDPIIPGIPVVVNKTVKAIIQNKTQTDNNTWKLNFIPTTGDNGTDVSYDASLDTFVFNSLPEENIYLNPFINGVYNYDYSEYNPIINNVDVSRPNNNFFDVDFSTNQITAVNEASIISASRGTGFATPSTIPESNYTMRRITSPRYIGKELESAEFNKWTAGDTSYGKTPNVSNPQTYFVYFEYLAGTYPEIGNSFEDKTFVNVKYIIDENGNATSPINDSEGINLGIIQQTFNGESGAIISLTDNDAFGTNFVGLNGLQSVFKSGYKTEPILFTQLSSSYSSQITFSEFRIIDEFGTPELSQIANQFWLSSSELPSATPPIALNQIVAAPELYLGGNGLGAFIDFQQLNTSGSEFSPIVNPFSPQIYDEIRFEGDEDLSFTILNVSSSNIDDYGITTVLTLDRNIPTGSSAIHLSEFLLRRYVPDPSIIILNTSKSPGGTSTGILKPQYISPEVDSRIDSILSELKNKNII